MWNLRAFYSLQIEHYALKSPPALGILGQVWYLIVSIPDLCNLITLSVIVFYIFLQLNILFMESIHIQV